MFLVQTFGSAYAQGVGSRPVLVDAFGNPLCITSNQHHAPDDSSPHKALSACCELACAGIAAAVLPPDLAAAQPQSIRLFAKLRGASKTVHDPAPAWKPGNPRAPPLTT
ncbi:hypothetical protein [Arvimicrobium flavum]|uniref:hypothetical protein n=1 Tax=Arvimicrobium flavum TaxID=3393320 RepID=UPI00237BDB35|nr:hypothetical protein [Mesorhizobium shangrilense]